LCGRFTNRPHNGYIAQQVDSAAQACHYNFNGVVKPQTSGGLYELNYTDFVVPLVKAVQEQQQQIKALQQQNQLLLRRIQKLENNK